jgi:DNA-binding HxlR family transcriptional regulator
MGARGSKPLSDRDWLIGARPRRLLLRHLLLGETPKGGWTLDALTSACGVGERGLDRHLSRLERLRLVRREGGRCWPVEPPSDLSRALGDLVRELDGIPDRRRR